MSAELDRIVKTIKPYLTAGFMCIALLMVVALRQLVDGPKFRAVVGIGGEAQFGLPVNTITDTEWEQVKHRIEERRNRRYRYHVSVIPPELVKDPVYSMPDCFHLWVRDLEVELPPFETDLLQFVDTEIQQLVNRRDSGFTSKIPMKIVERETRSQ